MPTSSEASSPPLTTGGITSTTTVKAIVSAVGQLLIDYALQLRDDVGPITGKSGEERGADAYAIKDEVDATQLVDGNGKLRVAEEKDLALLALNQDDEENAALTEEDALECRRRLQRLQRVRQMLFQAIDRSPATAPRRSRRLMLTVAAQPSTVEDQGRAPSPQKEVIAEEEVVQDCSATVRKNPVLVVALGRLDYIARSFQGSWSSSSSLAAAASSSLSATLSNEVRATAVASASTAMRVQPLLIPVSVAEGALSAFSRNVGVVFRRRPGAGTGVAVTSAALGRPNNNSSSTSPLAEAGKRPRDDAVSTPTEVVNPWAKFAAQQRKARFALYTCRAALLPRVNALCAPFYASPAVQELAALNSTAEKFMLQRAWCVHTQTRLLCEVPMVARDVEIAQLALRERLQRLPAQQQDALLSDLLYVQFLSTTRGVVRLCVQQVLYVDITYDVRQKQWTLLALHWNLYTTPAGASLVRPSAVLTEETQERLFTRVLSPSTSPATTTAVSSSAACCSVTPVQLLPEDTETLHAFLQKAFAQDGLAGGLQAAHRLVCAVVLDALAAQLQRLQHTFFTGASLGRLVEVEIRPGTFISFHLFLSEVLTETNASLPSSAQPDAPVVHVKLTTCGSTVVLERVRGTDLSTQEILLLLRTSALLKSKGEENGPATPPRLVLDMESLLWQCLAVA